MKRYLFATLVVFFGCALVDARPPHPQDFSNDKYSLENEGKHFQRKHPAEIKAGRRYGSHHLRHKMNPEGRSLDEMKKGEFPNNENFHKYKRPEVSDEMKGKWESSKGRKSERPSPHV